MSGVGGLRAVLRPDLLGSEVLSRIGHELRAGRACILRDVVGQELAEVAHRSLANYQQWDAATIFRQPFTAYNNRAILDEADFPGPIREWREVCAHEDSKRLMAELSGFDCSGEISMHASLFEPGEYQLPHNDFGNGESVSFTWWLTKDWDPRWGGHFFWCSPPTSVVPSFNTLILFRVTRDSYHCVCPVAPHAQGQRLAITGWWTGQEKSAAEAPATPWCRGPLRELGAGAFAIG